MEIVYVSMLHFRECWKYVYEIWYWGCAQKSVRLVWPVISTKLEQRLSQRTADHRSFFSVRSLRNDVLMYSPLAKWFSPWLNVRVCFSVCRSHHEMAIITGTMNNKWGRKFKEVIAAECNVGYVWPLTWKFWGQPRMSWIWTCSSQATYGFTFLNEK
jgi:hypothetical protein